jgi:hypothetical protein
MPAKNYSANLKIGATMSSTVGRVFGNVKGKIKEQESTLKKLRAAYKDASKGTGEYAGKLDQLQKEIGETEKKLGRLREASKHSFKGVGSVMANDFASVAKGAAIATAAIGALGGAVFSVTKSFVDWADDIGDSAEALGMSTQALQTWQFAAATVGVGGSKMTASIARFSKAIMDGGDATAETLDKLGLSAEKMKKLGLDDQLAVTAEAFKGYQGADKAAIAMKLFGKSGYQLAGILSKGKQGLDEFRKAGEKTGAILDDAGAKKAGDAAAALDMFGITMVGLRNTIAIQFVPTLQRLSEKFTKLIENNGPQIQAFATMFAEKIEKNVVPALVKFIDKMPAIIDDLASLGSKLGSVISFLAETVGGFDNLVIAMAALKFTPTIIAFGKLASSLYALAPAWIAGLGPVAWVGAAIAGIGLVIYSLIDPGGPMDVLGRMFPETMETVRTAVEKAVNWISDKFDMLGEKIRGFLESIGKLTGLGGFFGNYGGEGRDIPSYMTARPMGTVQSLAGGGLPTQSLGVKPQAQASQADLQNFISSAGTGTNNFNINVNAPGADGQAIGQGIRREIQRKPLYDQQPAR